MKLPAILLFTLTLSLVGTPAWSEPAALLTTVRQSQAMSDTKPAARKAFMRPQQRSLLDKLKFGLRGLKLKLRAKWKNFAAKNPNGVKGAKTAMIVLATLAIIMIIATVLYKKYGRAATARTRGFGPQPISTEEQQRADKCTANAATAARLFGGVSSTSSATLPAGHTSNRVHPTDASQSNDE